MKLSQIKPGLETPYGTVKYISGMSKDGTKEPLWQNNDYKYWWICIVRIGKRLVHLKFDHKEDYDSCRYAGESNEQWRRKLK